MTTFKPGGYVPAAHGGTGFKIFCYNCTSTRVELVYEDSGRSGIQCDNCGTFEPVITADQVRNNGDLALKTLETFPSPKNHTPLLIGFSGKKRSGKDSAGVVLRLEHGFKEFKFATALRELLEAIDPWVDIWDGFHRLTTVIRVLGWEKAKDCPEVRRLMKETATEGVRTIFGQEAWVNVLMPKVAEARLEGHPVVITDVRFKSEADAVRDAGGIVVRIERDDLNDPDQHSSETELDEYNFDYVLHNDATLNYFRTRTVPDLMRSIRRGEAAKPPK